jgi:putative ABC transport system permease protein
MISSYVKIALRYLAKNKIYSFINVVGLSFSLACVMLIILYTKDEFSFDKFHKNLNFTYLIAIDVRNPDGSSFDKMGVTSNLHGPRFKDNLPEIASFVRLHNVYKDIKLGEEVTTQLILEADTNFFSFFSFPLIKGNPKRAFQNKHSVIISEDMAIRHFGNHDALNKTILFESNGTFIPYTVTGIAKRCPQNSSIQFDAVLPIRETHDEFGWVSTYVTTFVRLTDGSNVELVKSKMQKVFEEESKAAMDQVRNYGFNQSFYHELLPFADVHLSQDFKAEAGLTKASNPLYSYILSGIGIFMLAIACINFINLTIARSTKRAREIGIRKIVGGKRKQLIGQFMGESFFLCFISFGGAMVMALSLLPMFNDLVNKELSLSYLMDSKLIVAYLFILILTGLSAGFYPAVILSSYNPVQTLYSRFKLSNKSYFQRGLIVFQFAMATFMVVSTITVYLQFDYLTERDLGYQPYNVLKVVKRNLSHREAKIFSEQLSKDPDILSVSPQGHGSMNGKINGDSIMNFTYEAVNENFIGLMKITLVQGRNFSQEHSTDSAAAVIINESFSKRSGWENPIGQQVKMMDGTQSNVIGVIKDYHYESLKRKIEPQLFSLAFNPQNPSYQHLLIRIQPGTESKSLAFIETTFKKLFPMHPYSYEFYDEINLKNYEAEAKWKQVILLSAMLTIFIAGIGLFGLSILTAESRFKEVGIRKVLGASATQVVMTIYKSHLPLIFFSLIVGMPAAYYASNVWLDNYPYRIDVEIGTLIGAGLFVLMIAVITISFQTIKTALLNPVDSIRME